MYRLIEKPHLIFLLSIPVIMGIGILSEDEVVDINVHDTYFVIAHLDFVVLISLLLGLIGIGYWIMQKANRKLSIWLNGIHIGLTFGGPIIVWLLTKFFRAETMDYDFNNNLNLIIWLIILLMVLGQLIFPINVIYGLMNKKTSS